MARRLCAALAERESEAQREAVTRGIVDRVAEREAHAMAAERRMAALLDRLAATEAAIRFERSVGGRPATPLPPDAQQARAAHGGGEGGLR